MSYKVFLPGSLSSVEWSQAVWKVEGRTVATDECERELLNRVLLQELPKAGLIVDAGCGTGRLPMYFRRLGYRIFGVEIDHGACVIAKENEAELPVLEADVRRMPFADNSVDAVLSLGVVEHDEAGPVEALRETHRILKPKGLLILAVPFNNLFRRVFVNRILSVITWRRRRRGMQVRFAEYRFTKTEVRRFLAQTGFEEVAVYPNDVLPPKNVGLWVDFDSVFVDPLSTEPVELFVFQGLKGKVAAALVRWVPWLVCAEVAFVARSR